MAVGGAVVFRRLQLPSGVDGEVHLHSMPGRCEAWDEFAAAAATLRIQGVVCLADDAEIARKSPAYAKALRGKLSYALHRYPIPDFGVPADEDGFAGFVGSIAIRVRGGERLLVHCGAGIGRTGTFACCLLIALGCSPGAAMIAVEVAGSHPERDGQRSWVRRFAPRHSV